jgi:hypothetical protein
MKTRLLLLLTAMLLSATPLLAQFSLTGELRPRAEYRHGFATLPSPDQDAAFFISQRTRLNLNLQREQFRFFVSFQDVRVWGEVPQLNRSDVNSSFHEAWGELYLSPEVTLKLGRQELVYDNSRILGNVDWAQQGRSHDLALLKWNTGENARLHAGFAFNQEWEPLFFTYYSLNNYKTMQFLWYNNQWENTGLSLLFLNNGIQYNHDRTVFSQTTGARVTQNAGAASLAGSFYLQTGRDGSDRELRAWYLAAEAAFPLGEQFRGIAGFEFLSGTDYVDVLNPAGTVNRSFTPLYGTNHAFNGHMDYFYVGNHINNVGLINPYFTATTTQGRWTFTSTLHLFWADGDVHYPGNPNELMSPYLGTEIDLIAGYTINPEASIRFGYSHMFASETMERIKGGSKDEIAHWAWIMVILKPTIFSN